MDCSIVGCTGAATRRGWCRTHYVRWSRHGDPLTVKRPTGRPRLTLRGLLARVTWQPDGCWQWTGALNNGYGIIGQDGTTRRVHRVVYEALRGPVPVGLDLDHLCRNRACCNVTHLEPVTRRENLRRGIGPEITRTRHAARRLTDAGGQ